MLIPAVLLLISVLVLVTARSLYDHSHIFFLLCTALERLFKKQDKGGSPDRDGDSGPSAVGAGSAKVRRAAAR